MRLLAAILLCHARALRPPVPLRTAVSKGVCLPVPSARPARRAAKAGIARSSTADDASVDRVTPSTFGDRTVGGVRLDRISRLVVAAGAAFGGYVLGNDYLNVAIVEVLGIDRSQGVGAFGPFVTLLALIYSTILGSIYSQLSSRQGAIQDSLFAEAFAVRDVAEVCDIVNRSSKKTDLGEARRAIRAHAETLRDAVDGEAADGADQASLARLLGAVDVIDGAAGGGAVCARAVNAYGAAVSARSARASALASTIPPIKLYSYVIISRILLAVFLLVDLGSLRFEAVLFATLVAAFQLIESFVEDLSDPFGGAWSVASAREEVDELLKSLPRD